MEPSPSSPLDSFMFNLLSHKTSSGDDDDDDETLVISSDQARTFTFQARQDRIRQWGAIPSRSSTLSCMRRSDSDSDERCRKQTVRFDTTTTTTTCDRFSGQESHQMHRQSRWSPTTQNRKISDHMPLRIPHRAPATETF